MRKERSSLPSVRHASGESGGSRPEKPADSGAPWAEFLAFLKKNGHRVTAARKIVFDDVMSRHDHFRADELAAQRASGPGRVSRGTVYRTLALLVKAEFVRAIRDGATHFHYEHIYGHSRHEHLVCEDCGAFIEFDASEIARAIREKCREKGFEERSHRLTILGTCENCRLGLKKKPKRDGESAGNASS